MATEAIPHQPAPASPLSPFRHRAFAVMWSTIFVSNIGLWMQNAAGGWLMTTLAPEPRAVALVQVASALPMFLLGLPAGALADIFDRRRMLLLMESLGTSLTGAFAVLVAQDLVTPAVLLGFVFIASAVAASIAPAWQAIVPQLVERREDLAPAIALNSVSINASRAIGPAIGGAVIGGLGIAAPFSLNALCNLGCIAGLFWWRAPPQQRDLPPERFGRAILVGLRHARYNQPLRATLEIACGFFLFASAYWALLPLLAREQVGAGPGFYGLLLGAIGVGAVAGALALPRLKARLGPDAVVHAGIGGTAVALVLFAAAHAAGTAILASLVAGMSWIAVLSTLNVSAQMALPAWVRGRGLAAYATVMFGATTAGSLAWGEVASMVGMPVALIMAAVGLLLSALLLRRRKLHAIAGLDLTPSMYWPEPVLREEEAGERGPVLVTIEYRVGEPEREDFLKQAFRLGAARKRNGAYGWGIFEDAAEPGRWIETFLADSWLEYHRIRERLTRADQRLEDSMHRFHEHGTPKVANFVGPRENLD